jgi:inositol phosphorylceramide mannosyltransferase catalytic subunit
MLILYEYGGIYIDADSVWLNEKNLEELINKTNGSGIFAAKPPGEVFLTNGVIGCTKHNKHMKWLVDEFAKYTPRSYKRMRSVNGVSKVTGPFFFNKIQIYNITIFPSVYFYPISWFGIKQNNLHETLDLPKESYMFQYGLTTNGLKY